MKPTPGEIKLKAGDRLNVRIDRLAVGGRGVARHESLVIFVNDTAPEEDVEIELTFVKKNFAEARLISVVAPSPYRRKPPCPVAGVCGGCSWQHVEYAEQLRQKRSLVSEAIRRLSGFEAEVSPVVKSPHEFRYRNRIQLHHAGPRMGFFKRGSHEIVDIVDCPITEHAIADQIPELKKKFAKEKPGRFEALINQAGEFKIRRAQMGPAERGEKENASENTGPAFAQVNTAQNISLIQAVVAAVGAEMQAADAFVFDLYAGAGNFTFPLARAFPRHQIVAVELGEENVRSGQDQLTHDRSLKNVDFRRADVADFLEREGDISGATVVLDPPRTGCDPHVMKELCAQRPAVVVYVSCHPVTLARDLKFLKDSGFTLESVQPFDMFPQTDHVETIAILKRRD